MEVLILRCHVGHQQHCKRYIQPDRNADSTASVTVSLTETRESSEKLRHNKNWFVIQVPQEGVTSISHRRSSSSRPAMLLDATSSSGDAKLMRYEPWGRI